jgi:hypothetical protein
VPDINCRDRDVRSLAEPESDRQVFAKFEPSSRKVAAAETNCITEQLWPPNAPTISETRPMPNPKSIMR